MRWNNTAVAAALAGLITTMERDSPATDAGLRTLVDNGVRHLTGSQYAGITLAEKNATVTNVVATHSLAADLDRIQDECGEGPCLDAAWQHHVMQIHDLHAERRWPRYRQAALEQTSVRSVLSYELAVEGASIAALNFYSDSPGAFTDDDLELGHVYAAHIALAWSILRHQDQFRSALASRDIIGQAKGVIMERFDLDAFEAFDLLTRLSQQSNTRLAELAADLIDSEHPLKQRNP